MKKKAIVVSGGSTGIGQGICQHLLALGYCVINLSRRASTIEHTDMYNFSVDLSKHQSVKKIGMQVVEKFTVTGFIHNAGLIRANVLENVKEEDLAYLTQVHIGSAISLTQCFLDNIQSCGHGRIVLISSRAALGLQSRTVYSATKSGIIGMARTWALELGQHGITVNVVSPGPIEETEMFDAVIRKDSQQKQALAESIPMQRIGRVEDVARAVGFFIHPDNSFVTGQTLLVCGGSSLGSVSL